jgi:hypothetical protein
MVGFLGHDHVTGILGWIQKGVLPERLYTAPLREGDVMATHYIARVLALKDSTNQSSIDLPAPIQRVSPECRSQHHVLTVSNIKKQCIIPLASHLHRAFPYHCRLFQKNRLLHVRRR